MKEEDGLWWAYSMEPGVKLGAKEHFSGQVMFSRNLSDDNWGSKGHNPCKMFSTVPDKWISNSIITNYSKTSLKLEGKFVHDKADVFCLF